jgi:hypothetical protein
LKLVLLAQTPHIETLIATAMLTTTSGAKPSALFHKLLKDPERVAGLVSKLETQHGSILEHNRLCWLMEANCEEVLDIMLNCRFFTFSRIGESKWIMSANLRTVAEFAMDQRNVFSEALVESLSSAAPNFYECVQRGKL